MARAKQTKGICAYCKKDVGKAAASRHFASCPACQAAVAYAEQSKRKSETLYHLRVQASGQPAYWLDLEMRGTAKLSDLDDYLRAIWLECCGHMSQFSKDGWGGGEIAKSRSMENALGGGEELTHIYDFGASSETLIKSVGSRQGKPLTKHPITLLMRNEVPVFECMECQQPATWFCSECVYEHEESGLLCDQHVEGHPHENYGEPVALVNSPRMGMCGYEGPAEPPY
ncbi:hypothetical protein [Methylomagnum sp.]